MHDSSQRPLVEVINSVPPPIHPGCAWLPCHRLDAGGFWGVGAQLAEAIAHG
ncbi:MAG: hypothetical protein AAFW95_09955 [Cyanobacteria bacterium J06638_6]